MRFPKSLAALLIGAGLSVSALTADVVVHIGPPRAIVETRPVRPYHDAIWIAGYHTWDGSRHVWVPGHWERPPRPHAKWEAHRWVKRHGGWVLVEGRWR